MQTIRKIGWADLGSWPAALASMLPLWLFSLAVTAEGFPPSLVSIEWAFTFILVALALSILLLWKGWMTFELLLYSLFPFFFSSTWTKFPPAIRRLSSWQARSC